MSSLEWARKFRVLSPKQTARPGKYKDKPTPWVKYWLEALDDPKIRKVVCLKSAQSAWTDGGLGNYILRRVHLDPCPMVLLFPKEKTIRKYRDQKFDPSIEASPALREIVDITTSRSSGNRLDYVNFPGGFLSFVASNAPDNIKSQSAPVVAVEEPDDCSDDVRGQGDSVSLLEQRAKSYGNRKVILGGTPTIEGHSRIKKEYSRSNQTVFMVPCHECGESHVLSWEYVDCKKEKGRNHEIYGDHLPETAYYTCPHCGSTWSDKDKNQNVQKLYPVITNPDVKDVAGFYINELYSPFDGSRLGVLMARYLEANHLLEQGDETEMISFINNTCGEAYAYKDGNPDAETIRKKAEPYPELQIPAGGLMLTMGVDVQPDRLAVIIRAWGRGEESWLVYWGEIKAKTSVTDINDPCWYELDRILFGWYQHETLQPLKIKASGIDSGDGNTNDAVYNYVRSRRNRGVNLMAIKGSNNLEAPIVTTPKKIDLSSTSKASRYGLQVWMVGVELGKTLMAGRLKLEGSGPGRMHFYSEVRADYPDQMTGESLIPSRTYRNKKKWSPKAGAHIEAWDAENYAMHASRVERIHLKKPADWDAMEAKLMQADLLGSADDIELITQINIDPLSSEIDPVENEAEAAPAKVTAVAAKTVKPKKRSLADIGRAMSGG
ncbi:MAG: phage terminase large subunit family protein [Amphritea sp.]|nr:phage terminase large subunit family protein [Amphritea sp.]